jgi:hypothetical protein
MMLLNRASLTKQFAWQDLTDRLLQGQHAMNGLTQHLL